MIWCPHIPKQNLFISNSTICTEAGVCVCVCVCVCSCVWEGEGGWVRACMHTYLIIADSISVCLHLLASLLLKQRKLLLQRIKGMGSSAELLDKLLWYHHNHQHRSTICLKTGQQRLSKLLLYRVPFNHLSWNFRYLLSSSKSSSSSSHLLLVVPSFLPFLQLRALEGS